MVVFNEVSRKHKNEIYYFPLNINLEHGYSVVGS